MNEISLKKKFFIKAFFLSLLFHLVLFIPFGLSILILMVEYPNFSEDNEFYFDYIEILKNIRDYPNLRDLRISYKISQGLSNKNFQSYPNLNEENNANQQLNEDNEKETSKLDESSNVDPVQLSKETILEDPKVTQDNSFIHKKEQFRKDLLPKKLIYEIFYGPLKLGITEITIQDEKIRAIVYTTGIGNSIYPFFAQWETWIDEKGVPEKVVIYSKDKEKERKKEIFFEKERSQVKIKRLLPQEKSEEIYKVSYPVYDELSSFIISWLIDYESNKRVDLPVYIKENKEIIEIFYKNKRACEFRSKEDICLELLVLTPEKSELIKRAREITIYLLEREKIPLEIKGKLPFLGSLTGRLKEIFP